MRTELFPGCEKILSRTSLVVMLGAAIALVFHWAWFCRHGLEFTDEGLYLLVAEQPRRNVSVSLYGYVWHGLIILAGGDLGLFRMLGLAGVLAAGGLLAWSWGVTRGGMLFRGAGVWAVCGVILSGSLLVFSDGRRTPGYDTLVFLGAVLGWSGYFLLAGQRTFHGFSWVLLITGILVCAMSKWVAALLLTPVWVFLLCHGGQNSPRAWLRFVFLLVAGAGAMGTWVGSEGLASAWNEVLLVVRENQSHGLQLIPYYGFTMVNFFYRVLRAFAYGLPVLFFLLWLQRCRPAWLAKWQTYAGFLPWLVLPIGLGLGLTKGGFNGFSRVGSNIATELLWLACAAAMFRGKKILSERKWENLGLLLTPFLIGVGTNTALGDYAGHGAVFFQIVGLGIWARWVTSGLPLAGAVPFMALTALFNLARAEFSLRDQFRTPPLSSCVAPWKKPDGKSVYLSPHQQQMLTALQAELKRLGYSPGDPLVAIGDLPGVVYLLGGWSPGTAWYFAYNPGSSRYVEAVLAAIPAEIRKKSFLIFRENSPLYVERRKEILSLLGQKEPPSAILGPLTFEEMTTRLMIWGPPQPAQPVNDRL